MTVHIDIWTQRPDRIKVDAPFRQKDAVKTIPGRRWDNDERTWHVPLSWAACKQLRSTFGDSLRIGADLAEWARGVYAERVERALELREPGTVVEDFDGDERMYEYQRVGIEFLRVVGRSLLADDMGLGKTAQTIQAMKAEVDLDKGPVLVVCPNSMTRTWRNEVHQWWGPEIKVEIVSGSDPVGGPTQLTDLPGVGPSTALEMQAAGYRNVAALKGVTATELQRIDGIGSVGARKIVAALDHEPADVYVINWEALRLHTRVAGYGSVSLTDAEKTERDFNAISWQAVVADEAHRAKNPKAKMSRALWWIGRDVNFKVALTGTPIADTPADLWSIMHFLAPEEYPTRTHFIDRYVDANLNIWGGMDFRGLKESAKSEFYEVFDPRFMRRVKEAVLTDLPPKTESIRVVEMNSKQARAYEQMAASMIAMLDDGVLVAVNPLVQMLRLSQFAAAYAEIDADEQVTLSAPSCKVDTMMDMVLDAGESQLVFFAESKQLINLCADALNDADVTYGMITGDISTDDRQRYVDDFQNGKRQVMLATVGAGGEGITLTAASTLVFLQRSWSMIKNRQAADRIYRIGQDNPVEIIDVVAEGTMEHYRLEALRRKGERLEEVVRDYPALAAAARLYAAVEKEDDDG